MQVDLKGTDINSVRQSQTGGAITMKELRITCMAMIDTATGWFENSQVSLFDLNKVVEINKKYVDKCSVRAIQLLN